MKIIVSVNAKGGCGKSTIAMNVAACLSYRGFKVLLIDMDPQAQITQWLKAGDGISDAGTLTAALAGKEDIDNVITLTDLPNIWFIPASEGLEALSRQMTDIEGYYMHFSQMLAKQENRFDYVVIDAPNQISPLMESAIWPADLFLVPFESTKAVRSYANFLQLVLRLRPGEDPPMMHVLSNLSKQFGLRKRVIETMLGHGIKPDASEVRTCGWLAQVDEHGGDIFAWRPHSIGAMDITALTGEILRQLDRPVYQPEQKLPETQANESTRSMGTFKLRDDQLIPESEYLSPNSSTQQLEEPALQELINHFNI